MFSAAGVSADLDKIQHIVQAGQPETIKDVRSLLLVGTLSASKGTVIASVMAVNGEGNGGKQ